MPTLNILFGIKLSTHDLTKRSTLTVIFLQLTQSPFNSRPHEEVDATPKAISQPCSIFQLTTSRRGRLDGGMSVWTWSDLSTHDLTKRSTCHISSSATDPYLSTHDLTKRSTPPCYNSISVGIPFNSRPHEEVDAIDKQKTF